MNSLRILLSIILLFVGVQQQHDGQATVIVVVRGAGPASFTASIPPGWDVTRTFASTGALTDDAAPPGTPPTVVRWSGVVSDAAPALVWVELRALPHAKDGVVVVGDTRVRVRAPGGVAPEPVKKVWVPIARHEEVPTIYRRWLPLARP